MTWARAGLGRVLLFLVLGEHEGGQGSVGECRDMLGLRLVDWMLVVHV